LARQLKLFLAYSSAREALVSAFHEELKKKVGLYAELKLQVEPWTDRDTVSEIILDGLIDHCRGSSDVAVTDFFAVFLTRDDLRTRGSGAAVSVPRDNCIFELGLFLGGMGFDKRRCFVISSVPDTVLPSDIRGWKFIPFTEPPPGSGPQADREVATALATEIRDLIYNLKDYTTPAVAGGLQVITADKLMMLERTVEQGGQLVESAEVLVNRAQPVELSQQEFAGQVSLNIRQGV
jgi:predicted nucleotide-binding protein